MSTPDELERAIERLSLAPGRMEPRSAFYTSIVRLEDLRLLLSERSELLATVERMRDKVEGLDSDLRCAVQVAYLRGATEWAKRNYPGMIDWLETCVTDRAALTTGEANHKDKP